MAILQTIWDTLQSTAATAEQTVWGVAAYEDHSRMLLTLGFCFTHSIFVWGMVAFFGALRKYKMFEKHRITDKEPNPATVRELYVEAIVDHLVVQWPFIYFVIAPLYSRFAGGLDTFAADDVPSVFTHVWQLAICVLMEDCLFYWVHRALHQKMFYASVHKEHHSNVINHPLAAQHAHIAEKLIGNSIPFWLPCILLNVHGSTLLLWSGVRIMEAIDAHSGYNLPFSPFAYGRDGARHDYHHSHGGGPEGMGVSGSYGSWLEVWDRVCGTDGDYQKYKMRLVKERKKSN